MKHVLLILPLLLSSNVAISISDHTFIGTDGQVHSFSDFNGSYLLIDFFATWCGPCITGIDELKLVKEYRGDVISLFTLSSSPDTDTPEVMANIVSTYNITWNVGIDENMTLTSEVGILYIPSFIIVSPEGTILKLFNATEASSAYEIVSIIDQYVPNNHSDFPPLSEISSPLLQTSSNSVILYPYLSFISLITLTTLKRRLK